MAPQQFGTLQICKTLDAATIDISNRIFNFTVSGVPGTIAVPVGSCSGPISAPAGPQTVTELNTGRTLTGGNFTGGFQLNRVDVLTPEIPGGSETGIVNLATRQVAVNVVAGGVAQQLTLRFVNQAAITGVIEICKFAATGPGGANPAPAGDLDVTGFFQFTIEGVFTTNQTNPTNRVLQVFSVPVGGCTSAISVTAPPLAPGTTTFNTRITELRRADAFLESVNTDPANRLVNFVPGFGVDANGNVFPNPGGGYITIQVATSDVANEIVVNFRNRSNPGLIKVCKIAGPGIPINTLFRFRVRGFGATNAAPAQFATYGNVDRTFDVRAGDPAAGGLCQFVPGFGAGSGFAEFQTFVNGTPVFVFEEGLAPGQSAAFIPAGGAIRVGRIRSSSGFIQPSPFAPSPNPDLTPGVTPLPVTASLGRAAVPARAAVVEVEFTNFIFQPTQLKVCKIAGTGVAVGTPFTFDVALVSPTGLGGNLFPSFTTPVTVIAGAAAQDGACTFVDPAGAGATGTLLGGAFNIGSTVTITERGTSTVTAITSSTSTTVAAGAATGGLSVNLGTRQATLFGTGGLIAGVNIVTFTNGTTVAPPGGDVKFDFNGDGRSDISVYRPSDTTWYVARSTGVPSQNFDATKFGLSTDTTVPADFDGDSKTDIANFRSSNGTWYILRSKDGLTS
ncbi:MAG: FG-GAP repeat domain-containing protein, partial [Pyrinomonadaceae bacterium]